MENLQDISFEQFADAMAIASKSIGLQHEKFSIDSSSLATIPTQIHSFVHARSALSESSAHTILVFGAGASFASLRERLIGASASVRAVTTPGEAVFTTVSYDSYDIAKAKLKRLKAQQFSADGREARVARALEILCLPSPGFHADKETWMWAAEDEDIGDI
jgi:hypothetical protein